MQVMSNESIADARQDAAYVANYLNYNLALPLVSSVAYCYSWGLMECEGIEYEMCHIAWMDAQPKKVKPQSEDLRFGASLLLLSVILVVWFTMLYVLR